MALYTVAVLHHSRREWDLLKERAEAEAALSTEQGLPLWLAWGLIFGGRVLVEQGQGEAGMAQMRRAVTAFEAIQSRLLRPYCLALLAEAHGQMRQPEAGLAALAEALTVVHDNGEHHYEAEIHRLKGELLLQQDVPDELEAERCLHQAGAVARQHQAKSIELRAAVSLSRLWQHQGKRVEARSLLAPLYGWFTEGFDTADLQDARALLEALA